ncbi:desulfoferrodoxin [Candidatus Woesearchaeota archaeon]|nr:desulfoferrodoxin [Candidatus Woesearchaeota archaeon]|tara:strand:+ start:15353 stop:15736 length:384 start_codon:yes stop_codon:yes gene_type:complete
MTKENEIYKCEVCGNIVSVVYSGGGTLVCCGKDMILLKEKTKEQEGDEKHVPVIEINGNNVKVKVSTVEHPMEEKHYITLIQLIKDEKTIESRKLYPGEKPEAEFCLENTEGITARELCNMHGLWTS